MNIPNLPKPYFVLDEDSIYEMNKTLNSHIINNIESLENISTILSTTLGPRGLDKLIVNKENGELIISNDGSFILSNLNIIHPIIKMLVDLSSTQDNEIGDGTTTVVLLTIEILKNLKEYLLENKKNNIKNIINSLMISKEFIINLLNKISITYKDSSIMDKIYKYVSIAPLNSKLIKSEKEYFSDLIIDIVTQLLYRNLEINNLNIIKSVSNINVSSSLKDSFLFNGVAFKKTFSYAGYEMMNKSFNNPRIILLNMELELHAEQVNNLELELNTKNYQDIINTE